MTDGKMFFKKMDLSDLPETLYGNVAAGGFSGTRNL